MNELLIKGLKGTEAVHRLRLQKLKDGFPFMINSPELVSNQCYLEFPDGHIELVSLEKEAKSFITIRELSPSEASDLRNRYHFFT